MPNFPGIEFGLHTHAYPGKGLKKIAAAWNSGIRRFDTVINGLGGCPMTDKELVGNLALEKLLEFCELNKVESGVDEKYLLLARQYNLLA